MRSLRKTKRVLSFVLALFLGLGCAFYNVVPAQAAVSYQGQGTKASPYLVETAAQLDGMRNNLSAHYKLANTIDMSSFGTLEPIGYEGEKFTGSFTCDTDSDGTPKYAIKNLKIHIDAGEKYGHKIQSSASYVDWVEGKNKWQAGLFGFTDGATIEHIAILNADVTNTVLGQNGMNKDYTRNPGQNDATMSTGTLIGSAVNTSVVGCMASGTINSKSNQTGGLIGYSEGGSISNSYATVKVTSSGYWCTGGLVGLCSTDLSNCFATGDVQGGSTEATTGGLIGQVKEGSTMMIVSCYSTGNISPSAGGLSMIGYRMTGSSWKDYAKQVTQNALNCYTTGNVAGYSTVQAENTVEGNNNYILNSSTGFQECFKAASMDEIKAGLATSGDYDVSGSTPTLKNVAVISDESKYVPGAVSDTATNATTAPEGENPEGENEEDAEGTVSVADVTAMIEALPSALELTIEDKEAVKEAKRAYDALTADQKTEISSENTAKLTEVYNQAVVLILGNLKESISELPKAKKLTIDDYDTVMALYDDYQFIGEENQSYLLEELREKLLEAVETVENLKNGGSQAGDSDAVSPLELAFMIVLSVLIVLVLAFNVVWSVLIIKKNRELLKQINGEESVKRGKKNEKKQE